MLKKPKKKSTNILEPLSILTKYKTSETPKIDKIFIFIYDDDRNIVEM
jgi:hypothetical protein